MIRRLPVTPTIVVLAAVAVMVGLGFWQLQRAHWKDGLVQRYAVAERLPPIAFPNVPVRDDDLPLFRNATGVCLRIVGQRAVVGAAVAHGGALVPLNSSPWRRCHSGVGRLSEGRLDCQSCRDG